MILINGLIIISLLTHLSLNGISQSYQLDQPISILLVAGRSFFIFYLNFNRTFCKQTVETLMFASDIRLCCLSISQKQDAMLILVKIQAMPYSTGA